MQCNRPQTICLPKPPPRASSPVSIQLAYQDSGLHNMLSSYPQTQLTGFLKTVQLAGLPSDSVTHFTLYHQAPPPILCLALLLPDLVFLLHHHLKHCIIIHRRKLEALIIRILYLRQHHGFSLSLGRHCRLTQTQKLVIGHSHSKCEGRKFYLVAHLVRENDPVDTIC